MLDVRRLRLLHELHARGTIAAVADALDYTASAVSQQLAVLEREAGVALLERAGRGVRLTDAGRILVGHTEAILERIARAEADLAAASHGLYGTVRIASFQTGARALVAPAIVALRSSHPGLRCELDELEAEISLPGVRAGEVDIAVAEEYEHAPRPPDPALERVELGVERLVVVMRPDHPAAASDAPVALGTLRDEPWITSLGDTLFHDVFVRACRTAGFEPDVRHRSNDMALLVGAAADGIAVSLVPMLGRPGDWPVAVRDVADQSLGRTIFAAFRRGRREHPAVAATIGALQAAAADAGLAGP